MRFPPGFPPASSKLHSCTGHRSRTEKPPQLEPLRFTGKVTGLLFTYKATSSLESSFSTQASGLSAWSSILCVLPSAPLSTHTHDGCDLSSRRRLPWSHLSLTPLQSLRSSQVPIILTLTHFSDSCVSYRKFSVYLSYAPSSVHYTRYQ